MPVFKGCPQRIDRIWPYKFSINKSCFRAAHCGGLQEVWRVEGARSGPCKGRTLEEESFDEARLKSSWGQMLECPVWSPEFVTKLMDMVWYGYIYIYTRRFLFMVYWCGWSHIFCRWIWMFLLVKSCVKPCSWSDVGVFLYSVSRNRVTFRDQVGRLHGNGQPAHWQIPRQSPSWAEESEPVRLRLLAAPRLSRPFHILCWEARACNAQNCWADLFIGMS